MTSNLFSELAKYSKKVRKNEYAQDVLDRPISLLADKVYSNGNWEKRTRVVLMASPCKVGTCSMCPFPDEGLSVAHLDKNIINQLKNSLDYSGKSSILTVYHNGNFFLDTEISPNLRDQIYEEVKKAKYKVFCVESLPQTISKKKIEAFEQALPGVRLEVCIGVQSCDPFVRKYCTLSPFSTGQLEGAFESLLSKGHTPRCFLMFGQPFLNTQEALYDTLTSIEFLNSKGIYDIVVCPLGVQKNTLASWIEEKTSWKPPCLQDTLELLRHIQARSLKCKLTINSSAQNFIKGVNPEALKHYRALFNKFNNEGIVDNLPVTSNPCSYVEKNVLTSAELFCEQMKRESL